MKITMLKVAMIEDSKHSRLCVCVCVCVCVHFSSSTLARDIRMAMSVACEWDLVEDPDSFTLGWQCQYNAGVSLVHIRMAVLVAFEHGPVEESL